MAIDVDNIPDLDWSDLRKAAKYALFRGCFGTEIRIGSRSVTFANADDAIKRIRFCDEMEAADEDSDTDDGIALVRYGDRV